MMFAGFDPQSIPEILNCGPMKLGRCYVKDVIDMDPIEEINHILALFSSFTAQRIKSSSRTIPDRHSRHIATPNSA